MEKMENRPIENLAETLAKELKQPFEIASNEFLHVRRIAMPPGWRIQEINDETLLQQPLRKLAKVLLDDAGSFISYVNRHCTMDTTIWVKADYSAGKIECSAIINDHGGEENGSDWRDHTATYIPRFSEEWNRWKSGDKKLMTQADFATFIEDNLADIAGSDGFPSGADMLRMAIEFEAKQDLRFKSAIRLQSGGVDLAFVQQEDNGTLQKMKLFDRFAIGVPVFWGDAAYRVEARLRYRVREGKLSFWYELIRADKVMEAAANAIVQKIADPTRKPIFYGTAFA